MTRRIALLMGSDSDYERLQPALETLRALGEEAEVRVLSAHRTPEEAAAFATGARDAGLRVLLCAAGGAAHLAGVIAAHTTLPVLGIPLDNPPLGGLDALLATVQMPGGVPVGTLGLGRGGPVNAALLALRILALDDDALAARLAAHRASQREGVLARDRDLQRRLESA